MNFDLRDLDPLSGVDSQRSTKPVPETDPLEGKIDLQRDKSGKIILSQLKGRNKWWWSYTLIMTILQKIANKNSKAIKDQFKTIRNKVKSSEVKPKSQRATTLNPLASGNVREYLKQFINEEYLDEALKIYGSIVGKVGKEYREDIKKEAELSKQQIQNEVSQYNFPEFTPELETIPEEGEEEVEPEPAPAPAPSEPPIRPKPEPTTAEKKLKRRLEATKKALVVKPKKPKTIIVKGKKPKIIARMDVPVNPVTVPESTPPSKQEIQNILDLRKKAENLIKKIKSEEAKSKALQIVRPQLEEGLELVKKIEEKERQKNIQKALDKQVKKENVDKLVKNVGLPTIRDPPPAPDSSKPSGDVEEDIIEKVDTGKADPPQTADQSSYTFKLPDISKITNAVKTGAIATAAAAVAAYAGMVNADNADNIRDVQAGLAAPQDAEDAEYETIRDTDSLDSAESTISNNFRRVTGRRMPEQYRTVLNVARNTAGSENYRRLLKAYNFIVISNQIAGFMINLYNLLNALNLIPSDKIKGLVTYFMPTSSRLQDLEVQEEQIKIPTQVIQQEEQGKGTLRPKFIIPTDKIFELTGNEVNTDQLEFSAFDYVIPTSEGTEGNVQNNPLKREAMIQDRILNEGGGMQVDSVFGMPLPYSQEQLRDLLLGPPLPRMEFKQMSEYEVGDNQIEPFDWNGDRTAIDATNPYRYYTDVHQMNQGFEDSVLYGYQP